MSESGEVRLVPMSKAQRDKHAERARTLGEYIWRLRETDPCAAERNARDIEYHSALVAAWDAAAGGEAAVERSLSSRADAVWTVDDLPHLLDEPVEREAEVEPAGGERHELRVWVIDAYDEEYGNWIVGVYGTESAAEDASMGVPEPWSVVAHEVLLDETENPPMIERAAGGERPSMSLRETEMQKAVDTALSAMRSSAYVGGPTEREAWQTAVRVLGPFETLHASQVEREAEEGERDE